MTALNAAMPGLTPEQINARLIVFRRHSARVYLLRRLLPGAAIFLVVLALVWIVVKLALSGFDTFIEPTAIRMVHPQFLGRDSDGQPYQLTAEEAVKANMTSHLVTLTKPFLTSRDAQGQPNTATGDHGVYNDETMKMTLTGHVRITTGTTGYILDCDEALVDARTNQVDGEKNVHGRGPMGDITSQNYTIYNKGESIEFRRGPADQVHALLKSKE